MSHNHDSSAAAVADSASLAPGDTLIRLTDLKAQATLKYSVKDYNAAAELYSQATELQAELNGEMSPANADLLYAYGRCLYHVAVKNSEVLGSKVAGQQEQEEIPKKSSAGKRKGGSAAKLETLPEDQEKRVAEEGVTKLVEEKDGPISGPDAKPDNKKDSSKPYFQFTGDENWDSSDDEGEGEDKNGNDEGDEAEDEDDFVNAYEVLDLARVLLLKRISESESSSGKGKSKEMSEEVRRLNERLADTYDLQAEISLEGERFPAAVVDLKSALQLKEELYPPDSSLLAEAHYKLSLALEFSSVTRQQNENGEVDEGETAQVDEGMREEAAVEMEAAIASCRLRIEKEQSKLNAGSVGNGDASSPQDEGTKATKDQIADVKEMVKDMEQRLIELRQPPVSINDPLGTGTLDGSNPLSGILGSILGESPAAQKARLEEASKEANDLTGLVKRKKPAAAAAAAESSQTNGKRKAESMDGEEGEGEGKKARMSGE